MLWYVVISVILAIWALSVVLPTLRRIWVFHLTAARYLAYWLVFWLFDASGLRRLFCLVTGRTYRPREVTAPHVLRRFCEDMGPTYIKFGQIVASSAGLFPESYRVEFQKCLDQVRPFPFVLVKEILANELGSDKARELGTIDGVPLASASIAQVHTAELASGARVVIKVQRPGIGARVAADVRIMRVIAAIVARIIPGAHLANPVAIVDDFAATLAEELDFRREADNLERFNEIMRELGQTRVRAPIPHWRYSTARVLVMERFFGVRVDHVQAIAERGIDAESALITGIRAWFQSVLFYGFFHGDVHAGNLMLLDDDTIGFLDFGIIGRLDEEQLGQVTQYLVSFISGDYNGLAATISEMGSVPAGLDMAAFAADLRDTYEPLRNMAFADIHYREFLPRIHKVARKHQMHLPRAFVLITKQMLYFDRYAKLLAPDLNVFRDPRLIAGIMTDIQKARQTGHNPDSGSPRAPKRS